MKKIMLVLVLSLLLSSMSMSFAQDNDKLFIDGNRVERVFIVSNGSIQEISIKEYKQIQKDNDFIQSQNENILVNIKRSIVQKGMTDDWYRYDESGNSVVLKTSERKRVSTVAFNGTTNPSSRSLSFSSSSSSSFSVSLNGFEANAVRTGVGFSWESSSSTSDTHTITMSPGEYGWLEFAPYKNKSWGHVKRFSWLGEVENARYVVTYSPREVGDYLDGVLYHMTSTTAP